ncbi:ABC transporter permease [Mesorhizobium sp. SP-1A]|uniref:ABC transporter permease n=1 Tax=Mesorhizobium sp. SP-1A TaxID=3077840 RepID=UPI0028F734F3|nr:ABC transporter permease [Mesorhizobium sp. SP-1A]
MADATLTRHEGMSVRTRRRTVDPGLFLLPLLALLLVVFVAPTLWFFFNSLRETGQSLPEVLKTIQTVLFSSTIRDAILKTNWISLVVTLVALVIAYPIAYAMSRSRGLALTLMVICIVLPYFTSIIVRTYSWMVILGRNGIVNEVLLQLGVISSPLQLMYNTTGVVIGMSYVLLPYLVLTLYAAMKSIDDRLLHAARSLGAGGFYTFRRVYLPLTLHGVFSGCLIVFILSIGFFITPALMGGPKDVMIAMLIEREVELTLNWPLASIMSLFLLAITLVLYAVYYRFSNLQKMMG